MKKVLITGAAGFIGFHLARTLAEQGYQLTLVDNLQRGKLDKEFNVLLEKPNVRFLPLDLTKQDSFEELDQHYDNVYHLAAINGTENFYKIPDQVLKVNVLSTIYLLEWLKDKKNVKVLYSSSSETYAGTTTRFDGFIPSDERIPLCIDDITNVRWSYGASKLLAESAFFSYSHVYPIRFSIVRYHNIYGPRMGYEHVMPQFFCRIFNKELPLKIYGGEETRAFCYISDAIRATQLVMESSAADGEIIHIGNDGEEVKILDLAKMVLGICGESSGVSINSAPEGSAKRRCPNTDKLKKLGFKPEFMLSDGLHQTMLWYKNSHRCGVIV